MKRISFKDSNGLNLTHEVLSGRKTMTRRRIPPYFFTLHCDVWDDERTMCFENADGDWLDIRDSGFAQYQVGDVVAIQQAYKDIVSERDEALIALDLYKIGNNILTMDEMGAGWNNKMFVRADLMPHHIRITNVHCERLQDISDEDCLREGVIKARNCRGVMYVYDWSIDQDGDILAKRWYQTPREAFASLIDKVSGRGTWESNPMAFVYEFELID